MNFPEHLIQDLPDPAAAVQFMRRFEETQVSDYRKLLKNEALLSDVLTLVAYSPLLATTLEQNPDYIWWLNRRRKDKGVRGKEELLESLARFSLTNSTLSDQVMFARFRRRELLRIYLADIRRQMTVAEITEELSNLADAILESALRIARQELDNRYGSPQETDERGRERMATFCVVTLGKLGSKELNYSSDIDLLFLYSGEGETTGTGSRGKATNREYFVKLSELITKLIGQQTGEGATYRVDLRLRPHGRVGPLAMSVPDTSRYYQEEAADWERQVLIRSRAGAGDTSLFADFSRSVRPYVYAEAQSVGNALRSVRRSKQKIDVEHINAKGFDVKLGKGGIREIEFIAQALQLAYGGRDKWLRAPHTLISLWRLADRGLIEDSERTKLFDAYDFLRRLEHVLQMENGLQTHLVPNDPTRRGLAARRMRFKQLTEFDRCVAAHSTHVNSIFRRIFSDENIESSDSIDRFVENGFAEPASDETEVLPPADTSSIPDEDLIRLLMDLSPKFREFLGEDPELEIADESPGDFGEAALLSAVQDSRTIGDKLSAMRREWRKRLISIAALDAAGRIDVPESKRRQTALAEASIDAALEVARSEMAHRAGRGIDDLGLAVMGLGKLGGAGIDYDSDLDLVLVFDADEKTEIEGSTPMEFYSRAAEAFVNALSSYTRDGNLYRVDLRLRPHGKNGPNVISLSSFESYMRETASIWELLAFVKLRAAGGGDLADRVWHRISAAVHERGKTIPSAELAKETRRVRLLLEKERSSGSSVNIKYGPGGMLDIYFAIRYLQLRDNVPDTDESRSSGKMLEKLRANGSLSETNFTALHSGYQLLSSLDHVMRLVIGRSHLVPHSGNSQLPKIAGRIGFQTLSEFHEALSLHRISVREAFNALTE